MHSAELNAHDLEVVVTHSGATTDLKMPIFKPETKNVGDSPVRTNIQAAGKDGSWIRGQIASYYKVRSDWAGLFSKYNAKVFVTWYKYDASHMAIADALRAQGGVTAIYQRAYESHPSAETAVNTDIMFSFSQGMAEVETKAKSKIRYHVTTGYLGDHRFPLLKSVAQLTRQKLEQRGAKRILAYFDENTSDDPRWSAGHEFVRRDYAFLLSKVLEEPWLGLVIKRTSPITHSSEPVPNADGTAKTG